MRLAGRLTTETLTIAFGVRCLDGVVLVTDSLTQFVTSNDSLIRCELGGRKVGRLGEHAAYVVSGAPPDGYQPAPEWAGLPIEESALLMFRELNWCASKRPVVVADGRTLPTELLIGDAATLLLFRQQGNGQTRSERAVCGSALVGGAMGDWARTEGVTYSPPATLAEAVPFAVESCRDHLWRFWHANGFERLADFTGLRGVPGGAIPPSAPPFHLAVITATAIESLEFS